MPLHAEQAARFSTGLPEDAVVVAHQKLGLDLMYGVERDADDDQNRRAAEIEALDPHDGGHEVGDQGDDRQKDGPAIPLPNDLENYMQGLERNLLIKALEDCNYNKTKAAEKLGISFRAMRYKLKKLGID